MGNLLGTVLAPLQLPHGGCHDAVRNKGRAEKTKQVTKGGFGFVVEHNPDEQDQCQECNRRVEVHTLGYEGFGSGAGHQWVLWWMVQVAWIKLYESV